MERKVARKPLLSRARVVNLLLILLFLTFLLDPGDNIFHAKVPLFAVAILSLLIDVRNLNKSIVSYSIVFLIIPFFGAFVGFISGNDMDLIIGITKSACLIILAIIVPLASKDMCRTFSYCCLLTCMIVIVFFFIMRFGNVSMVSRLYDFGNKHVAFTLYERSYGGVKFPTIYFHSSPMFVFASVYFSRNFFKKRTLNNFLKIFVLTFGFFVTGTRANMLMSVAAFIAVAFYYSKQLGKVVIITAVITLLVCNMNILDAFFSKTDPSNSLKLDYFNGYSTAFFSKPLSIIWGAGTGGAIYSAISDSYRNNTELTYMNILYWFGIPLGGVFIGILLYPFAVRTQKNSWVKAAYVFFLMLCFVNPFLLSSNGMTIVSLSVSTILAERQMVSIGTKHAMKNHKQSIYLKRKDGTHEKHHTRRREWHEAISADKSNK